MKDTGRDGKRKGTGLKKKDETRRKTAVLGGDAVARAKVGSEGGVEVAAKTGEDRGVRDRFLKDARVGALVAPRVAGGRGRAARRKSTVRGLCEERNDHRGAARKLTGFAGEIALVAKGWSGERNEYESN